MSFWRMKNPTRNLGLRDQLQNLRNPKRLAHPGRLMARQVRLGACKSHPPMPPYTDQTVDKLRAPASLKTRASSGPPSLPRLEPGVLSRTQRQRLKYRSKPIAREARQLKRMGESGARLEDTINRGKTVIVTIPDVKQLPLSTTGFIGPSANSHGAILERLKRERPYFDQVLRSLQPIAFEFVPSIFKEILLK
jgi:hypothetical protein